MLSRLHRLSALNPPPPNSHEELKLLDELNNLVSLMEGVKDVQLPLDKEEIASLLSEGVGEVHIGDETEDKDEDTGMGDRVRDDGKSGRELLDWATRRTGDYYAKRIEKPKSRTGE